MTDKTMTLIELRGIFHEAGIEASVGQADFVLDAITRHFSQPAERGQAVAWISPSSLSGLSDEKYKRVGGGYMSFSEVLSVPDDESYIALYTAPPPAAGLPERWEEKHDDHERRRAFGLGWNACREAMISASPSPTIDVAGVPDESVASFVEKAGEIIGGKPFPSGQSLAKAREICDLAMAMAMLSATPSPTIASDRLKIGAPAWPGQLDGLPPPDGWVQMKTTIDVAAVREVIAELIDYDEAHGEALNEWANELSRAIGDAK